jgi:ferrous iron transport protein B
MATILVAPLMSCSARLPVYTVLIAAFIPAKPLIFGLSLQGLVLFAMYLLGVLGAAVVAWLLKLSVLRGKPALFVMEMPAFRVPSTKIVLRDVVDRVLGFLKNATTVILACSVVLWFLASYPRQDGHDATVKASYAGQIGTFIEPVIKPLGFNWEIGVGILASFAAREVFISSLATVYNLQESADSATSLIAVLKNRAERGEFSLATALSLMVFYVFACQCISTLAVTKRETGGWRWPAFMFLYMTALAYGASFLTYQLAQRML